MRMGISWGKHVADTDLQATGYLPHPCLKAVQLKQGLAELGPEV